MPRPHPRGVQYRKKKPRSIQVAPAGGRRPPPAAMWGLRPWGCFSATIVASVSVTFPGLCFFLRSVNLVATWGRCFGLRFGVLYPQ